MLDSLPELPTDNLYKFMALSGLIMFCLSLYFPWKVSFEYVEKRINVEEEVEVLRADSESVSNSLAQFSKLIDNTILVKKGLYTNSQDKLELSFSDDEIKQMRKEQHELVHVLQVNFVKVNSSVSRIKVYSTYAKYVPIFGSILSGISAWIAIHGFRKWYLKIQLPIDQELENALKKRKKKEAD